MTSMFYQTGSQQFNSEPEQMQVSCYLKVTETLCGGPNPDTEQQSTREGVIF